MGPPSGASPVEPLQKPVSGEFDVFVTPLGGPVVAGDQPRSVDAAEVTIDERVAALGLVARSFRKAEMPLRVLVP